MGGQVQKAIKVHIIKEQLGQQVGGTGLLAKRRWQHPGPGSGFGVAFGAAGSVDIKFRLGLATQTGPGRLRGKVRAFRAVWGCGRRAGSARCAHRRHSAGPAAGRPLPYRCPCRNHGPVAHWFRSFFRNSPLPQWKRRPWSRLHHSNADKIPVNFAHVPGCPSHHFIGWRSARGSTRWKTVQGWRTSGRSA